MDTIHVEGTRLFSLRLDHPDIRPNRGNSPHGSGSTEQLKFEIARVYYYYLI